ncbi:MAG: hypothetical protein ACYCDN_03490 [Schaalia turicensis]
MSTDGKPDHDELSDGTSSENSPTLASPNPELSEAEREIAVALAAALPSFDEILAAPESDDSEVEDGDEAVVDSSDVQLDESHDDDADSPEFDDVVVIDEPEEPVLGEQPESIDQDEDAEDDTDVEDRESSDDSSDESENEESDTESGVALTGFAGLIATIKAKLSASKTPEATDGVVESGEGGDLDQGAQDESDEDNSSMPSAPEEDRGNDDEGSLVNEENNEAEKADKTVTSKHSTGIPPLVAPVDMPLASEADVTTDFPGPIVERPKDHHALAASAGEEDQPQRERGLIDPTKPTLVFAAVLTILAAIFGTMGLLKPVGSPDLAQSLADAQSANHIQSDDQSAMQETTAPLVSSVSVLSWSNDDGDHPDTAVNMIDGDPATTWHSRYYDMNSFADDNTVTIVIKLSAEATVSQITLNMDQSTSGGELVVRNVTDADAPRRGTELARGALSPATKITLPEPVTTSQIALSFATMPTSVDGNNWAWVSELSVQ